MKLRICLLTLFITTIGLTIHSQQIVKTDGVPPANAIQRMRITLVTGDDDLRSESRVSAFLITRDGRRIQSPPLNCQTAQRDPSGRGWIASRCDRIPNNTRRTFEWKFDKVDYAMASDVHRFGLIFESGRRGPLDTGDNWNLDGLEVEYFAPVAGATDRKTGSTGLQPTQLVRKSPVYRFKTGEEWQSDPIASAAGPRVGPAVIRRP